MKRMTLAIAALAAILALAAATAPSRAETAFPTRTVKMIVPYPPGGGTDLSARVLAQRLGEKWKQSVIVENVGGAERAFPSAAASVTAFWPMTFRRTRSASISAPAPMTDRIRPLCQAYKHRRRRSTSPVRSTARPTKHIASNSLPAAPIPAATSRARLFSAPQASRRTPLAPRPSTARSHGLSRKVNSSPRPPPT